MERIGRPLSHGCRDGMKLLGIRTCKDIRGILLTVVYVFKSTTTTKRTGMIVQRVEALVSEPDSDPDPWVPQGDKR